MKLFSSFCSEFVISWSTSVFIWLVIINFVLLLHMHTETIKVVSCRAISIARAMVDREMFPARIQQ